QVIELGPKQATLPAGADSKGTTEVPYTDVRAVMIMRRGQSEWVMVETEEGRFGYAAEAFERPDGARRFRSAIMGRIRRHPEADRILDRMRQLEETAELATRNGTPVTYTLLALVIGIYVYEYASGALASEFGLLDLGAISTALIEQGQYFRLVSGSFLHGGFVHILFNGLALLFLGISIERMIGSWRFLLIFLVSALGGATGSYLWTEAPLAVGSSTALYGLIGAFGVLHVKYWDEMPPPYRQTVQWWAVILVLNIGISLLPMIDAAAHFAGMGVGIVATYLVTVDLPDMDPTSRAGTAIKIATAAMTALFAAGLAQASNYADSPHPDDRLRVVEYEVDRAVEAGDHRRLNRLAWRAATQPEPTVAELKLAQRAIRAALDERANGLRYLDTQATVFFRLARASEGERRRRRLERAIEIERRALREGEPIEPWAKKVARRWAGVDLQATVDRAVYWSQLARFLSVYRNDYGVYRPGDTSVTVSSVGRSAAGVGVSLAAES
ncbi:MAG: rhomboid family intramembrane serine protease, partial [Bradymonadaceae bacterium]